MAIYQLEKIARDVRVAMEQNAVSRELSGIGDVDTLTLEEVIGSKIAEGVRRVHLTAPVHLLESGHHFGDRLFWDGEGSGHVLLPDDFLRLVVFQMSDWIRPVYTCITPEEPTYVIQHSRFRGVRGCPEKPVCAIVMRPEGLSLEFYSCKDEEAWVRRGIYIPIPCVDADDGIDICKRCYMAAVYAIAADVLATYGETERCQIMNELSAAALK